MNKLFVLFSILLLSFLSKAETTCYEFTDKKIQQIGELPLKMEATSLCLDFVNDFGGTKFYEITLHQGTTTLAKFGLEKILDRGDGKVAYDTYSMIEGEIYHTIFPGSSIKLTDRITIETKIIPYTNVAKGIWSIRVNNTMPESYTIERDIN